MINQPPLFSEGWVGLTLADGSRWGIAAGDERANAIVSCLTDVMLLRPQQTPTYQLLVLTDDNGVSTNFSHVPHEFPVAVPWTFLPPEEHNTFTCIISPALGNDMLVNQLMLLSLVIVRQAQNIGGILLHSALIERDGCGIILAGPGGVGKTTASRRITPPWRSLSDDETLVVRDQYGVYWAHPWPTWSELMAGGQGGTWDVEHTVPLKAIFFLEQALHDGIEPLGVAYTVPLLVELAEQTSWLMSRNEGKDVIRTLRLQRFENICTLVKRVPSFRLRLSLHGAFWQEIERVITEEE